jgi:hypothetical protein
VPAHERFVGALDRARLILADVHRAEHRARHRLGRVVATFTPAAQDTGNVERAYRAAAGRYLGGEELRRPEDKGTTVPAVAARRAAAAARCPAASAARRAASVGRRRRARAGSLVVAATRRRNARPVPRTTAGNSARFATMSTLLFRDGRDRSTIQYVRGPR